MIVGPMRCICTRDPGDLYPSRFSVRFRTCSAPREGVSEHPHPDPEHREHILGTCLLGVRRPIVFWMKGGGGERHNTRGAASYGIPDEGASQVFLSL